jgi:CheY-like chemotaxis protein
MQDVRESAFSNLLVVDDEPSIRIALVQMLTEIGYFVRSAKEGFSALREIRESTPDLIVPDLNMPGMSGFELLYVVRHRFPSIRVIAMCETSSIDEMRFGMADALYRKGSDTCSLLKLFEACPGRSGCLRTSPRLLHSAFNDTQAPPPETLRFDRLRRVLAHLPAICRRCSQPNTRSTLCSLRKHCLLCHRRTCRLVPSTEAPRDTRY